MTAAIAGLARRAAAHRGDRASPWRHFDVALLISVVAIASFGLLMIYSATQNDSQDPQQVLKRQVVFVLGGVLLMGAVTFFDYRLFRDFAQVAYVGTIGLLLLVLSPFGAERKGTQAWFQFGAFQFQPSEWAKVALIICVAAYCAQHRGELDARRVATVVALSAVPIALIYLQGDLGTALVFLAILLAMLLVGGARGRHLLVLALMGVTAVALVLQLGVLKQYQLDRLTGFLDPQNDVQRSTYNLKQSMTAIGSGGVTGKGLFEGSQTNLSFVPEQHTDFIFTVVGEELGLIGSGVLLLLFALVVWRIWRAAALAKDLSGTLICVGVMAMFVFQIFENVGMTMGIMPITGIPLPFMSYGGSSTLASFAAIGLVLNVHMRRFT